MMMERARTASKVMISSKMRRLLKCFRSSANKCAASKKLPKVVARIVLNLTTMMVLICASLLPVATTETVQSYLFAYEDFLHLAIKTKIVNIVLSCELVNEYFGIFVKVRLVCLAMAQTVVPLRKLTRKPQD